MPVLTRYTYAQAIALPLPVWDLQITNWGNIGAGADPNSVIYQGAIPSGVEYIGMGPLSTVDQVFVDWTLTAATALSARITEPANVGVRAPGIALTGPLRVRAELKFGDTYYRDGAPGGIQPFGTALPLDQFEAPFLDLLFYPRTPTVYPGQLRAVMYREVAQNFAGATPEAIMHIWPVAGRAAKSVVVAAGGTITGNVRVGAIGPAATTGPCLENTVATGPVNGPIGQTFGFELNRRCEFLAVYFECTGGTGSVRCQMIAED